MLLHRSNLLVGNGRTAVKTAVFLGFLITLVAPLSANAGGLTQATGPAAVVTKLYRDFAWEALSSGAGFGSPLAQQPRPVLEKYFDSALASRLIDDATCVERSTGEVCNLDFNVIFASQDPSASDLEITSLGPNHVAVSFTYPGNGHKLHLEYVMTLTRSGWRIKDVIYHDWDDQSLVRVLSNRPSSP